MKEKLLKHKEDLEKAIEQTLANLNFLQGQKAYNESLLKELEDVKEEKKEDVLEPGN
jgi:hypothetical protein